MKKIIILNIALLFAFSIQAEEKTIVKIKSWEVIRNVDDFNDTVSCTMFTKNFQNYYSPGLIIKPYKKHKGGSLFFVKGSKVGHLLEYRVDKGDIHDVPLLNPKEEEDYDKLISKFKKGNNVVYSVADEYGSRLKEKVSLKGFTKAYNIAKKCKK